MRVGITGSAGFIGMHLTEKLLQDGNDLVTVDMLNPSYGTNISKLRADHLREMFDHKIIQMDLSEKSNRLNAIFEGCEVIVHLAAWPGVRQSSIYPEKYFKNNVIAHSNMLSVVESIQPEKFFYASSSSVYGNLGVSGPVPEIPTGALQSKSFYAATKIMNEIESNQFPFSTSIEPIALRFFTVFGPWGRPDMAYWSFAEKISKDEAISLYGAAGGTRNFTYIKDTIEIVSKLIGSSIPEGTLALNIASSNRLDTVEMVSSLSRALNIQSVEIVNTVRPKEDVEATWADTNAITSLIGTLNATDFDIGINNFVEWFQKYRNRISS
jgi:UDP-glucuronate 4-epimerase